MIRPWVSWCLSLGKTAGVRNPLFAMSLSDLSETLAPRSTTHDVLTHQSEAAA